MADQNLLTIFLAVVTLAVLIQAGILAGFYFMTSKLTQQADRAVQETEKLLGPMNRLVETLQTVSARAAEFGATTQGRVRTMQFQAHKMENAWQESLNRWTTRSS